MKTEEKKSKSTKISVQQVTDGKHPTKSTANLLTKNIEEFSGKSLKKRASRQKKNRKGNKTRQKNKRGDSKVESNDSPEIPDRGETSDIPGLPSGDETGKNVHIFEEVLFFKLRTTIQQKTVKPTYLVSV